MNFFALSNSFKPSKRGIGKPLHINKTSHKLPSQDLIIHYLNQRKRPYYTLQAETQFHYLYACHFFNISSFMKLEYFFSSFYSDIQEMLHECSKIRLLQGHSLVIQTFLRSSYLTEDSLRLSFHLKLGFVLDTGEKEGSLNKIEDNGEFNSSSSSSLVYDFLTTDDLLLLS